MVSLDCFVSVSLFLEHSFTEVTGIIKIEHFYDIYEILEILLRTSFTLCEKTFLLNQYQNSVGSDLEAAKPRGQPSYKSPCSDLEELLKIKRVLGIH